MVKLDKRAKLERKYSDKKSKLDEKYSNKIRKLEELDYQLLYGEEDNSDDYYEKLRKSRELKLQIERFAIATHHYYESIGEEGLFDVCRNRRRAMLFDGETFRDNFAEKGSFEDNLVNGADKLTLWEFGVCDGTYVSPSRQRGFIEPIFYAMFFPEEFKCDVGKYIRDKFIKEYCTSSYGENVENYEGMSITILSKYNDIGRTIKRYIQRTMTQQEYESLQSEIILSRRFGLIGKISQLFR